MPSAKAWLERARWQNRTKRFGELGIALGYGDLAVVTMELVVPPQDTMAFWNAWTSLPDHPALIHALDPGRLRYAAIDWRPSKLDPGYNQIHIARYGLELCDLYDAIIGCLGSRDATWLVRPIVKLDVAHNIRVAFVPPPHRDREANGVFVRAIGLGLEQLITVASESVEVGRVIRRCIDADRENAFQSIEQLRAAFRDLEPDSAPRGSRAQFEAIEQGIGAYWHRKPTLARLWIERAVKISPSRMARDLLAVMNSRSAQSIEAELASAGIPITAIDPLHASTVPEVPVPRLFENAYQAQQPTKVRSAPIAVPSPPASRDEEIEELFRKRAYRVALERADVWLAEAPSEPRAHHVRGKALLALGRLPDARAAFDRACTLQPQMLEAMLLRREVDRVMSTTQASAGIANPMVNTLPDHLADLRDVLISGRIVDAIQFLRRPAYDDDTVARLLLAHLLCVDGRPEEALDVLAAITADEAHDLRARALTALGRDAEAEVEMSTYLRLIEQRSDRRIGSK